MWTAPEVQRSRSFNLSTTAASAVCGHVRHSTLVDQNLDCEACVSITEPSHCPKFFKKFF